MSNFYQDVIKINNVFNSKNRINDISLLELATRQKVQAIIKDATSHGINLMIYETYRSQERQELLFEQGATQLRKVGVHHYGLACDIVKSVNGDPSWKGDFSILGHLAKAHNLIWGGDWGHPELPHSFRDYDHVQRVAISDQARLFNEKWYPDFNYNPYQ